MKNFPERQTHLLLVIGVGLIEIVFFTVVAAVGGNFGSFAANSAASTNTALAPNIRSSSTPGQSYGSNSRTNSAPNTSSGLINSSALQEEVGAALNDWKSAAEAHDLDSYMNCYADTVDYYKAKGWSRSRVRADKQRAFSLYERLEVTLENVSVSLDSSGARAAAVVDKNWTFTGAGKSSSGSVRQQLTLVKSGGRWLIAGEKDLKVYYSRSY